MMKTLDLHSKVDHRTISSVCWLLSHLLFFFLKGIQIVPLRLTVFYFCQGRSKQTEAPFMAEEDIVSTLEQRLNDCPEEVLSELAEHLVR